MEQKLGGGGVERLQEMGEEKKPMRSNLGGAAAAWRRDRFTVSLFFLTLQTAPSPFVNFLHLEIFLTYIYRKNVAWSSKLVPQLSFFVNFDFFLFFFIFFENEQYQHRLK